MKSIVRLALWALVMAAFLWNVPARAAATTPVIQSTIFDPSLYASWTPAVWDATISDAKNAGFTSITLQFAVKRNIDGTITSFYSSTVPGTATGGLNDILGTLFPILKKYNMHIRIGLLLDMRGGDQWYNNIAPAADDAALTKKIADDLWGRYWNYSDLMDGWYLPGEVNTNFAYGTNRVALANYYQDVVGYLHSRDGKMSVMVSPYFNVNAGQSPANWTSLWQYVLDAAPIDIIALQDGTGDSTGAQNQAQIDGLSTWFAATKTAIGQSSHPGTQLWDNLDLYRNTGGAIALDTLTKNVEATRNSVSQYTSFSWFSVFAPWGIGTSVLNTPFVAWNLAGLQ